MHFKKIVLFLLLVITGTAMVGWVDARQSTAVPAPELGHAVLPEQCRADVRLWYSQSRAENDKLSFNELQQRSLEISNCMRIDTGTGETAQEFQRDSDMYRFLWSAMQAVSGQRLRNYVQRHDETQQFLAEDAAGLR